jgi:flagellar biosynthesis protein FlhG
VALEFFLLAGSGIVVTTPALTSILNAYLFLKNVVFRLLYDSSPKDSRAWEVLESLRRESGALQKAYVPRIIARIAAEDPESGRAIAASLARFKPQLVLNMLEQPGDVDRADRLRRSAREYLGVDLSHLGVMYRDELQGLALGSRLPIVRYKPRAVLSQEVRRIAGKLLGRGAGSPDESFHLAEEEAESDFRLARRLEEPVP